LWEEGQGLTEEEVTKVARSLERATDNWVSGSGVGVTPRGGGAGTLAEGRRRLDNQSVSLLAYSLRRAWGSLLVFLVVIWFIQFAVLQNTGPTTYIARGGVVTEYPLFLHPILRLRLVAASEWRTGALAVGIAIVILLGLVAAWRLRGRGAT
jgi:hypothetical protein